MASFKLNIANPTEGKCYKTEVKDAQADAFMGVNVGEKVDGSKAGFDGYEFEITGGTDFCGFPMRRGILGTRKKLTIYKSVGFSGKVRKKKHLGAKKRMTVCGHKVNNKISAINLKVTKEGGKKLADLFAAPAEGGDAPAEAPKEEKKTEEKKEEPAKEEPKAEEKKEEEKKASSEQSSQQAPAEEKKE